MVPSKRTLTGEPRGTRGEPVALMGAISSSVMAWGRMRPVTAGPQLATLSTAHTAQHGAACHFLPHECPSTSSRRFAVEAAVPSLHLPLRKTSCGTKMWLWYHNRPSQPMAQLREAAGRLRPDRGLGVSPEAPKQDHSDSPAPLDSSPTPFRIHLVLQQVFSF